MSYNPTHITKSIEVIIKHEGFRGFPYDDLTGTSIDHDGIRGNLTIGHGILLPLTEEESKLLLRHRLIQILQEIDAMTTKDEQFQFPLFADEDILGRFVGLASMAYNLGAPRFMQFRKMISALQHGDNAEAAKQALDSKWARQVGSRSDDVAGLIEHGDDWAF